MDENSIKYMISYRRFVKTAPLIDIMRAKKDQAVRDWEENERKRIFQEAMRESLRRHAKTFELSADYDPDFDPDKSENNEI